MVIVFNDNEISTTAKEWLWWAYSAISFYGSASKHQHRKARYIFAKIITPTTYTWNAGLIIKAKRYGFYLYSFLFVLFHNIENRYLWNYTKYNRTYSPSFVKVWVHVVDKLARCYNWPQMLWQKSITIYHISPQMYDTYNKDLLCYLVNIALPLFKTYWIIRSSKHIYKRSMKIKNHSFIYPPQIRQF